MKDQTGRSTSGTQRNTYSPGTYLRCGACGRLLKIEWATRSIVCACGARINPTPGK